jgi:hypothetical protein
MKKQIIEQIKYILILHNNSIEIEIDENIGLSIGNINEIFYDKNDNEIYYVIGFLCININTMSFVNLIKLFIYINTQLCITYAETPGVNIELEIPNIYNNKK